MLGMFPHDSGFVQNYMHHPPRAVETVRTIYRQRVSA